LKLSNHPYPWNSDKNESERRKKKLKTVRKIIENWALVVE
jgi:hypothetical protein